MNIIFVAGSWGSGTSSVIGALDAFGIQTLGPHFHSNDPRTVNTFELQRFREVILQHIHENSLQFIHSNREELVTALTLFRSWAEQHSAWSGTSRGNRWLALKMPLASACLPEIVRALDARIIVVHRPMKAIEATRLRRNWPEIFGAAGAHLIYNRIFADALSYKISFLGISYDDFIHNPKELLSDICRYCDINIQDDIVAEAIKIIRKPPVNTE